MDSERVKYTDFSERFINQIVMIYLPSTYNILNVRAIINGDNYVMY